MRKSTKIRLIIYRILSDVYKKNSNFDNLFDHTINENILNDLEKSFIFNVCQNTMRYSIHSKKILKKFAKEKLKINQYILLASAITQIVFLNIKPYAVVNETVEVSKIIKLNPSFINALLKNISYKIKDLKKTRIYKNDFPLWFQKEISNYKEINLDNFLDSYFYESSLHVVFKTDKNLQEYNDEFESSSSKSAFVKTKKKVVELKEYKKGNWWVQNFSSMLPVMLIPDIKNRDILDLCAAPGGKSFQILSQNKSIVLNDISKKRIKILKENLERLKYSAEITNYNALEFPENKKFDIILLDAPCSAIGTIRGNPEIIFREKAPNLSGFFDFQKKLLLKSSRLLKPNGMIVYMVCSFFFTETIKPLNSFLNDNKEFKILSYKSCTKELGIKSLINEKGYFLTPPTVYKNFNIDGFFSVQLTKNA